MVSRNVRKPKPSALPPLCASIEMTARHVPGEIFTASEILVSANRSGTVGLYSDWSDWSGTQK
jgi:hypothetical protein